MSRTVNYVLACLAAVGICACGGDSPVGDAPTQVFLNGRIYTVDSSQAWVEAFAVRGERILAAGTSEEMRALAQPNTSITDLEGRFVMPGFIEWHAHFGGFGNSLLNLNLLATRSWREIIDSVSARAARAQPGEWIYGRGWHQEKWNDLQGLETIDGYPLHDALSAVSPNNPVVLTHASGHGAMANAAAMKAAGISAETADPAGGRILRDVHGEPIGVFEERATKQLYTALQAYYATLPPERRLAEQARAWQMAEQACLAEGITSFQDAGTSRQDLDLLRQWAEADSFDLRLWMMIREGCAALDSASLRGLPWVDLGNHHLTVRAIKTELDGALGSYGAWLLADYSDKAGFQGQNTTTEEEVRCIAELAFRQNMQLCVHAIGDRANRVTLDIVDSYSSRVDTALRWRNEHAQHLHPDDIPRFGRTGTIASMQAVHAISDAAFVEARLGTERTQSGAYAWRSLWDSGAIVTNGTDAPVEPISALASLYAMITRRPFGSETAFVPAQALTRAEAIRSYTINNAYAAFEERDKGSLEVGKLADFIVLDQNLLECTEAEILSAKVLQTWIGGKKVFDKN